MFKSIILGAWIGGFIGLVCGMIHGWWKTQGRWYWMAFKYYWKNGGDD